MRASFAPLLTAALSLLELTAAAAPVAPSAPAPVQSAPAPDQLAPAGPADGEKYVGVAPGSAAKNPLPAPKAKPNHLVWTGFRMTPEGSQVFMQTTQPVTYEIKTVDPTNGPAKKPRKGGHADAMSVFLRNCRIHLANNRRALDTRFFATPVAAVSARQRNKDVELRISLKEPTSATPRTEPGPDGTQFVVLAFPPGKPSTDPPREPRPEGVTPPPTAPGASGGK